MKVRLLILIPRPLSFSSPTLEPAAGGGELIFIPIKWLMASTTDCSGE